MYLASTVHGLATPFIISTILCLIGWLLLLPTKMHSQRKMKEVKSESSFSRYKQVVGLGWIALLGAAYYMAEAMLNSNLPVYALRKGWSVSDVSFLLPAFAVGVLLHKFRSVY